MACLVGLVSLNLHVINIFHLLLNVDIDELRFSAATSSFVLIQIILCVLFLTNTNTSLHSFLDAAVEKHASNSAEEAYGKNTNLNIALYE